MTLRITNPIWQPPPAVRTTLSSVQRKCACGNRADAGGECAEDRRKREGALQRAPATAAPVNDTPPIVDDVLRSSGQPLDEATRAFMEPRFGHDFSRVRVHTDAEAAESARAVNALAYTIGPNLTFAAGQYEPTSETGRRLLAHELTHVVQQRQAPAVLQGTSLKVGVPGDRAEREADQIADALVSRAIAPPSIAPTCSQVPTVTLQRQPAKSTTVRVEATGVTTIRQLTQGKGGSGAVVYDYPARAKKPPADKDIKKPGLPFDITLPLLIYPPAILEPPKVDLFVFFHGMRAEYGEGKEIAGGKKAKQGSEEIALWTHLQEAVAGTNRLGIAPQAPATWRIWEGKWEPVTAQWHEALANIGFDGLVKRALEGLTRDLGLATPLVPGEIHVAGHSAGGQGIIESTSRKAGAQTYGDMVQDVTLQDASYGFAWRPLMDWFLEGSPGKTVRALISQTVGGTPASPGDTRSALINWFNVKRINEIIAEKKKSDTLKAELVGVPDPKLQKPRPGGFVLESQLIVKNLKTGATQGTMVAFFAPGGGHYETVTASMGAAAAAGPKITADFLGEAKPGQYRVISENTTVFQDKDLSKPTKQAPAGRGSKAKDLVLPRDTIVEVTALELVTPRKVTPRYIAKIKSSDVEGWTPLAGLAPPTVSITTGQAPPTTRHKIIQPKRMGPSRGPNEERDARTQKAAVSGLAGSGTTLPYLDRIQRAFGPRNDLSTVRAHLDERSAAASRSIGAAAYTIGDAVAFDGRPDLHTAVHEATHVVQQRRGVSLPGGLGREDDPHEQHANAVADAVVAGHSAALLLDGHAALLHSPV